jgi:hypothetical protein
MKASFCVVVLASLISIENNENAAVKILFLERVFLL